MIGWGEWLVEMTDTDQDDWVTEGGGGGGERRLHYTIEGLVGGVAGGRRYLLQSYGQAAEETALCSGRVQ